MPTRLVQLPHHPNGKAVLQVAGPAQAVLPIPETLEISVIQPGAVDRYLHPQTPDDPWRTAVFRFRPVGARREGELLLIEIDEWITYHLRPSQPYKLVIRQVEGLEIEERFTGPATMRRVVTPPSGWVQSAVPADAVPAPAPEPPPPPPNPSPPPAMPEPLPFENNAEPLPVFEPAPPAPSSAPLPIEPADRGPVPSPPPTRKGLWLGLGVLLIAAAAGISWVMLRDRGEVVPVALPASAASSTAAAPPASAAPGQLDSLTAVRDFLATSPSAEQALEQANTLAAGKKLLDGQLLLYKSAGERGNAEAARKLGAFYDPDTWSAETSPLPAANPMQATRWYKQAAEAGDAESQYRYAMLLKQGRTDVADGPEQAVLWLRKAADQGHAEAKKALGN